MHCHDNILEILFVVDGNGFFKIGANPYTTGRGDILVYNAGVVHDETATPNENLMVYCLGLTNVILPGKPPNHLLYEDSRPVMHAGKAYDDFNHLFGKIHDLVAQPRRYGAELVDCLVKTLLVMAAQLEAVTGRTQRITSDHVLVEKLKKFIDAHYMDSISLASLAEEAGVSPHYISHLFKDFEGMSPMRYVIRRRIGEAQSLLINSDDAITTIAFRVGYNNSNHFHMAFNKLVGLTPQNYRKYWAKVGNSITP